jgi:dTDP-4-dehydrorhamnose reductase
VRSSAIFGPWDRPDFVRATLRSIAEGRTVMADAANAVSPTYLPDLVHAALDLVIDGADGVWHLTNEGRVSWYELAVRIARSAGADTSQVTAQAYAIGERRTAALATERGQILPSLDSAVARCLSDMAA